MSQKVLPIFQKRTGMLILEDGSEFRGIGVGARGTAVGEICFNTSITGYQEILTDPSYAGQIITFTFPHIGNTGANSEDNESLRPRALGALFRADISSPSNFRSCVHFDAWLRANKVIGLAGIDTRALTLHIRDGGAPKGVITHYEAPEADAGQYRKMASDWEGLKGMDLAREVGTESVYSWSGGLWRLGGGFSEVQNLEHEHHVVAIDYGAKHNIFRNLARVDCAVTVVPPQMKANAILDLRPDGIFLSNGPGDPAATAAYAVPVIKELLETGIPIFGICLGHQLLALALGARTAKMHQGHRGANHPVKDLSTGKVEITSQNHGFVVLEDSLPVGVKATHVSLFDETIEGIMLEGKPIFSVQYHPEASPGPQDSRYLFSRFSRLMDVSKRGAPNV